MRILLTSILFSLGTLYAQSSDFSNERNIVCYFDSAFEETSKNNAVYVRTISYRSGFTIVADWYLSSESLQYIYITAEINLLDLKNGNNTDKWQDGAHAWYNINGDIESQGYYIGGKSVEFYNKQKLEESKMIEEQLDLSEVKNLLFAYSVLEKTNILTDIDKMKFNKYYGHIEFYKNTAKAPKSLKYTQNYIGVIVDQSGKPMAGISVSLQDPNDNSYLEYGKSRSDGTFSFSSKLKKAKLASFTEETKIATAIVTPGAYQIVLVNKNQKKKNRYVSSHITEIENYSKNSHKSYKEYEISIYPNYDNYESSIKHILLKEIKSLEKNGPALEIRFADQAYFERDVFISSNIYIEDADDEGTKYFLNSDYGVNGSTIKLNENIKAMKDEEIKYSLYFEGIPNHIKRINIINFDFTIYNVPLVDEENPSYQLKYTDFIIHNNSRKNIAITASHIDPFEGRKLRSVSIKPQSQYVVSYEATELGEGIRFATFDNSNGEVQNISVIPTFNYGTKKSSTVTTNIENQELYIINDGEYVVRYPKYTKPYIDYIKQSKSSANQSENSLSDVLAGAAAALIAGSFAYLCVEGMWGAVDNITDGVKSAFTLPKGYSLTSLDDYSNDYGQSTSQGIDIGPCFKDIKESGKYDVNCEGFMNTTQTYSVVCKGGNKKFFYHCLKNGYYYQFETGVDTKLGENRLNSIQKLCNCN